MKFPPSACLYNITVYFGAALRYIYLFSFLYHSLRTVNKVSSQIKQLKSSFLSANYKSRQRANPTCIMQYQDGRKTNSLHITPSYCRHVPTSAVSGTVHYSACSHCYNLENNRSGPRRYKALDICKPCMLKYTIWKPVIGGGGGGSHQHNQNGKFSWIKFLP